MGNTTPQQSFANCEYLEVLTTILDIHNAVYSSRGSLPWLVSMTWHTRVAGTAGEVMRGFEEGWPHLGLRKAIVLHVIWSRFSRRWGAYHCIVPLTFTFGDMVMGLGH